MKLFAALGPGDIVAAHRAQIRGQPNLTETSIIYSGQIAEFCRQQNIAMLAISQNKRKDTLLDDLLQLENRPPPFDGGRRFFFHFSKMLYSIYLATRAKLFGADLAIVDSGTVHYFTLALFRLLAIPIAVNFHNTLWPNGFPPSGRTAHLMLRLDAWFFRNIAVGAIGVSPECGMQLRILTGSDVPFFEYRCQFRASGFRSNQRRMGSEPFRVLFAGRAERSKGLLDIVDIAQRLRQRSKVPVVFEVCGDGSALRELRRLVQERNLTDAVTIHGRLTRTELLTVYARAHAVIVPTRSDFCEGMPHVCAEAVLSGLPVVTSRLTNSIPVIGPAVAEAEPENVHTYVEAIQRLAEQPEIYRKLSEACPELSRQFLDRSQSYPAAIDRLLTQVFPDWRALPSYEVIFAQIPN